MRRKVKKFAQGALYSAMVATIPGGCIAGWCGADNNVVAAWMMALMIALFIAGVALED